MSTELVPEITYECVVCGQTLVQTDGVFRHANDTPVCQRPVYAKAGTGERRPCKACPGHVVIKDAAPDLLPGLQDPLPIPEMANRPADWAEQPAQRDKHIKALRWLIDQDIPPPAQADGTGVVIVGGGRYWFGAAIAARMVRDVCDLPVQIWYRGDGTEPVTAADLADVPNVTLHDSAASSHRICRGWEQKTIALLHCGFERVLYLDADAYPVADPVQILEPLSEDIPFVYWQDQAFHTGDLDADAYGLPNTPLPPVQGGQLFIHRRAFWRELVIAYWCNQHSDFFYHSTKTYRRSYGDQDQWRAAMLATGRHVPSLGEAPWHDPAFVINYSGWPLLIHRCRGKLHGEAGDSYVGRLPGEDRVWWHRQQILAARNPV